MTPAARKSLRGLTVSEVVGVSVYVFGEVRIQLEVFSFGLDHADDVVSRNRQPEAAGVVVHATRDDSLAPFVKLFCLE